jgi:hypothetical protein
MIWPGSSALMSASTGAPPALARSDGSQLAANGTAAATLAAPPAAQVPITKLRLVLFTCLSSLIGSLWIYKVLLHAKVGNYTENPRRIKVLYANRLKYMKKTTQRRSGPEPGFDRIGKVDEPAPQAEACGACG